MMYKQTLKKSVKNIIKCSQCDEEFPSGYEYRLHWEQKHFYPYVSKNSFNFERAKLDKKVNYEKFMENMGKGSRRKK